MPLPDKIIVQTHVPLRDLKNFGIGTIVLVPDRKSFFDSGYYEIERRVFECDGRGICSGCDGREWEAKKIKAIYRSEAIRVDKGYSENYVYNLVSEH